jgi:NAD(P)-dependent dehydrogenase (short-subunit alcohol dehydrogenase family)
MQNFRGRVAVVTGAASGIGFGLAERFAAEGMRVVLADIEEGPLGAAAQRLRSGGAEAMPVCCDVSRPEDVDRLAAEAVNAFGAVHVVCNNAGVADTSGASVWEASLEDWQWVVGVNFWGVVHGIRAFVPLLLQQDEGYVVNTASAAGLLPGQLQRDQARRGRAVRVAPDAVVGDACPRGRFGAVPWCGCHAHHGGGAQSSRWRPSGTGE